MVVFLLEFSYRSQLTEGIKDNRQHLGDVMTQDVQKNHKHLELDFVNEDASDLLSHCVEALGKEFPLSVDLLVELFVLSFEFLSELLLSMLQVPLYSTEDLDRIVLTFPYVLVWDVLRITLEIVRNAQNFVSES